MKLTLVRGIPGAGKTTQVAGLNLNPNTVRCSADDFFINDEGVYVFDLNRIGDAHGACFRKAVAALIEGKDVIVDNTNISAVECAPYMLAAQAYGAEAEVVTVLCNPRLAAARNTHGVPEARVFAMDAALRAEDLPVWWETRMIEAADAEAADAAEVNRKLGMGVGAHNY
jgi:predicted kinase